MSPVSVKIEKLFVYGETTPEIRVKLDVFGAQDACRDIYVEPDALYAEHGRPSIAP
jgi:hypothetical protein